MSLCKDCVKGKPFPSQDTTTKYSQVTHEGTPKGILCLVRILPAQIQTVATITKGKWKKIGGVDFYVVTPTRDYPQNKAILFLSDAFGPQLHNNQVRSPTTLVTF